MGISKALNQTASPISSAEFAHALFSTWRRPDGRRSNILGLAISGGVDSMALAALCSRGVQAPFHGKSSGMRSDHASIVLPHTELHAFVVDHGVRQEATLKLEMCQMFCPNTVLEMSHSSASRKLIRIGIKSRVLKIDWGGSGRPVNLPNFESQARKYRYQMLGKACRDLGIDSLFLAHHEDDQAETVMMRMINGHRMLGLAGMKRSAEIPECYGIHGVHESGGLSTTRGPFESDQILPKSNFSMASDGHKLESSSEAPASETGGVRIYRPLLGFSKARLIATCRAERMEWFEDHTNKDPTLTVRNAIRHMYSSHSMPTALATSALLGLSKNFEIKSNFLLNEAILCLRESTIRRFETRSGILIARFIQLDHQIKLRSRSDIGLIAALMLREVTKFITPEEHVHLHTLHGAVERIFPVTHQREDLFKPTAFTVASVLFRPLITLQPKGSSFRRCDWLVSRQPHSSTRWRTPTIHVPPSSPPCLNPSWSLWTLYDGRFWFRVQNKMAYSIIIRPFSKHDLKRFRHSLPREEQDLLRIKLKELAPGDVRWTLPALAARAPDGGERVLALPTLCVSLPDIQAYVNWEVKYKKVAKDLLPSMKYLISLLEVK